MADGYSYRMERPSVEPSGHAGRIISGAIERSRPQGDPPGSLPGVDALTRKGAATEIQRPCINSGAGSHEGEGSVPVNDPAAALNGRGVR
jgi:hypothetical protein